MVKNKKTVLYCPECFLNLTMRNGILFCPYPDSCDYEYEGRAIQNRPLCESECFIKKSARDLDSAMLLLTQAITKANKVMSQDKIIAFVNDQF